jgi:hypothetical protein
MAVVLIHQGPSVTKERYEETVRKLTDGKSRMESPSDWPVPGLQILDHRVVALCRASSRPTFPRAAVRRLGVLPAPWPSNRCVEVPC